jgi:hypothetical protein
LALAGKTCALQAGSTAESPAAVRCGDVYNATLLNRRAARGGNIREIPWSRNQLGCNRESKAMEAE